MIDKKTAQSEQNAAASASMEDAKIKVLKDGPYEVDASLPVQLASVVTDAKGDSLDWQYGKSYDTLQGDSVVHLCRCGHSKGKPFCDGTHNEIHFDGTETADNRPYEESAKRYSGENLDMYDKESLCAVGRFCDVGETAWRYAFKSGDEANHKEAVRQACHCPSGRLTAVEKDGARHEPELPKRVSPVNDTAEDIRGPLWVQGGIPVESAGGENYEVRNRVTLCRCGDSGNKPFCDGSHLQSEHMRGTDK